MSILLPGDADVVAMAEQTLVAMHKFGYWLADVISAPRRGMDGVLIYFLARGVNAKTSKSQRQYCDCSDHTEFSLRAIHPGSLQFDLVFSRRWHGCPARDDTLE